MKLILYLAILTFIATANSYVQNNSQNDLLLKRSYDDKPRFEIKNNKRNFKKKILNKIGPTLFQKAEQLKRDFKEKHEKKKGFYDTKNPNTAVYELDPILNILRKKNYRRQRTIDTSDSSSSSLEMKNWKDEWMEHWIQKKFEAINTTDTNVQDTVNMAAAKPWGVPCGDPNQHDMPWGTCMLHDECESEYRIYRGDYFCGRTQFVCCALQLTNYDLYHGFDMSFEDSALSTDSEEKRHIGKGSKEKKRRKKKRDRKKKKRERLRRKRKIKKNIKKIVREIRKILNRAYKNGTTEKNKRTKVLKKFVEDMKKKYKNDRQDVKNIHEDNLIKIDSALQIKLNQIRDVNEQFVKNSTFRDILLSGKISRQGARMLVEAYPDLSSYFSDNTRRFIGGKDHLDYDIEYGMLYY